MAAISLSHSPGGSTFAPPVIKRFHIFALALAILLVCTALPARAGAQPALTLPNTSAPLDEQARSINFIWTLVAGFLVMFMMAGFALVETGMCRAKNVAHTMSMNFLVYSLGMIGFFVCGYAFMMGGINGASCRIGRAADRRAAIA